MLALLPFERIELGAREPGVDRRAKRGVTPEPCSEDDVRQLDPEPAEQVSEGAELVHVAEAVLAVPARRALRRHKPVALDVAEHPRRPARLLRRPADREVIHGSNINTCVSMLLWAKSSTHFAIRSPSRAPFRVTLIAGGGWNPKSPPRVGNQDCIRPVYGADVPSRP